MAHPGPGPRPRSSTGSASVSASASASASASVSVSPPSSMSHSPSLARQRPLSLAPDDLAHVQVLLEPALHAQQAPGAGALLPPPFPSSSAASTASSLAMPSRNGTPLPPSQAPLLAPGSTEFACADGGSVVLPAGPNPSSYLRSEPMTYIRIYIPSGLGHPTVLSLGELNESKSAFQLPYVGEIRLVDELLRRLQAMQAEAVKVGLPITDPTRNLPQYLTMRRHIVDEISATLAAVERRVSQMNSSLDSFLKLQMTLWELSHVIDKTEVFFASNSTVAPFSIISADDDANSSSCGAPEITSRPPSYLSKTSGGGGQDVLTGVLSQGFSHLNLIAGVILRSKSPLLERLLARAMRDNVCFVSYEIFEPFDNSNTDEPPAHKNVFIILVNGAEMTKKVSNLTSIMGGTIYPVSNSSAQRRNDMIDVATRLKDISEVLAKTNTAKRSELAGFATKVADWEELLCKEKAIYTIMNMFSFDSCNSHDNNVPPQYPYGTLSSSNAQNCNSFASSNQAMIAEGWVPTDTLPRIQYALTVAKETALSAVQPILTLVPTYKKPPTYFKQTKLTSAFQAIIDAYGMARYREINPALFAIATLPFFFAVMFGDMGHGAIVLVISIFLCLRGHKLDPIKNKTEFGMMMYNSRYVFVMMGAFSIYTGLLYNDIFSRTVMVRGTMFKKIEEVETALGPGLVQDPDATSYPFGVDWTWGNATNFLVFLNNVKMKMSVIFGVVHMNFGIVLALLNQIYYGNWRNVVLDVVPQFIFLNSLIGYLVVLIFIKWCTDWQILIKDSDYRPPGLLNTLINMVLKPTGLFNEETAKKERLYMYQEYVQAFLLLLAGICIPWMLFVKPYLQYKEHKNSAAQPSDSHSGHSHNGQHGVINEHHRPDLPPPTEIATSVLAGEAYHEFNLMEAVVHQTIHVIEFCLGCISNTASYLRLWALSLAHSQLSEVLYDMPMGIVLGRAKSGGPFMATVIIVFMFAVWAVLSLAVLVAMEGLSAFLHSLRLHWVEFNSKFYEGTGYKFEPFAFHPDSDTVANTASSAPTSTLSALPSEPPPPASLAQNQKFQQHSPPADIRKQL